jgi:hypothetical protein
MTPPRSAQRTAHARGARSMSPSIGPRPFRVPQVLPHRDLYRSPAPVASSGLPFTGPDCTCEHAFVSIKGSPYANFQRSLETRKLPIVLAAAAELSHVSLDDALEILVLMAEDDDPRFERAAARWVGRLLTETPPMTLKEVRWAVAMVEQLPHCRESLLRLARPRLTSTPRARQTLPR